FRVTIEKSGLALTSLFGAALAGTGQLFSVFAAFRANVLGVSVINAHKIFPKTFSATPFLSCNPRFH
ncbi:MAG: hypothetical protein IKA43_01030, partial [Clostridia bacterium]|nr:hypothetical protein [Clostridia bacterium]